MRVLLVQNAESGSAGDVDAAASLRDLGCDVIAVDIADAARWGDTPPRTRVAGVERVVVAGGDGSIAPAGDVARALDVPLGVVPSGTANDFARMLDLPSDAIEALRVAVTSTTTRAIDVGTIDGRSFVNVASIGLADSASQQALPLKKVLGPVAYPIGAVLGLARSRPVQLDAIVDGAAVWSGDAWQVIVAGTGGFGGFAQTGEVEHGDGCIDLFVVPAERGGRRLVLDAASLRTGNLAARDGVVHARAREIHVRTSRRRHMVIDGERVRARKRLIEVSVAPDSLQVVVP